MRLDIYLYKFQNNKLMERTFVFKTPSMAERTRTYVHVQKRSLYNVGCLLVCFVVK